MIKETQIFKYFRSLNWKVNRLFVEKFGKTEVFITITDSTYYIFDLAKFDILFVGPYIPQVGVSVFHRDSLYIASGNKVLRFLRASCVEEIEYENPISQILGVGDMVFVVSNNHLCVQNSDGKITKQINTGKLISIHHPQAYVNKILLIYQSHAILYNFIKEKEVYRFKSLSQNICYVVDSKIVDIVGVGYEDGRVDVVNLKKDKIMFSFPGTEPPTEIDFSSSRLLVVAGGVLRVFDLEDKRIILKRNVKDCAKFLDENHILLSSLDILDIDRDLVVRSKPNCQSEILGIECVEENYFLVFSKAGVFRYNTGNTSTYTKYKFVGQIEKYTVNGDSGAIFGQRILYKLGSSIKKVLSSDVALLATHKNICGIRTDNKIVILNLDTQRIYRTITFEDPVKDIKIDRKHLFLLSESKLKTIKWDSTKFESEEVLVGEDFISFQCFESFILLIGSSRISLLSDGSIFRTFNESDLIKDVTVSPDLKWLAYNTSTTIYIYDILSASLLDTIPCESKFIRFSQDTNFLIVITFTNDIVLLSNKTMWSPNKHTLPLTGNIHAHKKTSFMQATKKSNKLYNEILLQKTLGHTPEDFLSGDSWVHSLKKEDLREIIQALIDNLSVEKGGWIISKLMMHKDLERKDLEILFEKYSEAFSKFEENYLKSVGYLELENEKLV
ncbi:U3 small nucleolar RNA-associated protein 21 like protein [Nosema granulosis]|uniref:U3 small nucleolar RNA-associated protein 21 like protein n=1 Tax=Nosema granulosis TaxID=83296 RepID=A0A9P6GZ72_9MICR|nr:U3 small nucleolar RNA-associated protein 21 like protein [Nosema granulosis]